MKTAGFQALHGTKRSVRNAAFFGTGNAVWWAWSVPVPLAQFFQSKGLPDSCLSGPGPDKFSCFFMGETGSAALIQI
jgi:hypothetical protein